MTAYLLVNHLLNLAAPAALVALLLVALCRIFSAFFRSKPMFVHTWWSQVAINFVVGAVVLAAGLFLLGRDAKMLTYVMLVLAMAVSQWCQLGGWKR